MKNTIFVGPKNETIHGLKFLLTQKNQWCGCIEEVMNITTVNPNNNSDSSASLNKYSFPFRILDISLPQDQIGPVFLMPQNYNSYVHIGSTLSIRTNPRNYYAVGYASVTNIAMHLRLFVLIAFICGFRKDSKIIEYTKDQ